jgi:hypothetical protein
VTLIGRVLFKSHPVHRLDVNHDFGTLEQKRSQLTMLTVPTIFGCSRQK